jgi:hypothetical protein
VVKKEQPFTNTETNTALEPASEVTDPLSGLSPRKPSEPFDYTNTKPVVEYELKPRKRKSLLEFVSSKGEWYDPPSIKNNENNFEDVPF